jgi:hypothetical protein
VARIKVHCVHVWKRDNKTICTRIHKDVVSSFLSFSLYCQTLSKLLHPPRVFILCISSTIKMSIVQRLESIGKNKKLERIPSYWDLNSGRCTC